MLIIYPLGEKIEQAMKASSIRRADFVRRLGYRNVNNGLRELDKILCGESMRQDILNKSQKIFGIATEELEECVKSTMRILREEEEGEKAKRREIEIKNFKPYIYIKHERSCPKSISMVCFIGLAIFKYIKLPPCLQLLSRNENLAFVGKTVSDHYNKEGKKMTCLGGL